MSNKILIGKDENNVLIEISSIDQLPEKFIQVPFDYDVSQIASLAAQVAPSMMTSNSFANRQIMEVVINGNLTKAADGNGFRAFSQAANGQITENARLFETNNLSNFVNTAAIWQVASVIVAQKNLADINHKLDILQEGINHLKDFLEQERKSKLLSILSALKEKSNFLEQSSTGKISMLGGESELSRIDMEVETIYTHVVQEISQLGKRKIEHKEMFGTADLKNELENKILRLKDLYSMALFCINLRIFNVNFYEYLNGDYADSDIKLIKDSRLNHCVNEIRRLEKLNEDIKQFVVLEIQAIKSVVNNATNFLDKKKGKIIGGVANVFTPNPNLITNIFFKKNISDIIDNNFKTGVNLVDLRKISLHETLKDAQNVFGSDVKFSLEVSKIGIQSLINRGPYVNLVFEKIEKNKIKCINNNQVIELKDMS